MLLSAFKNYVASHPRKIMPWFRWLLQCLLLWKPGFLAKEFYVGFVVHKMAHRQVSVWMFQCSTVNIMSTVFYACISSATDAVKLINW